MIFFLFRKGKGKGSEPPNLPEWFQYFFFSSFGVRIGGLLVSLLLLFCFLFLFGYPLDMYLILSVVLSTLCTILFQYRKSFKEKKEIERRKEEKRKCVAV